MVPPLTPGTAMEEPMIKPLMVTIKRLKNDFITLSPFHQDIVQHSAPFVTRNLEILHKRLYTGINTIFL